MKKSFAIIGLGRFGLKLVEELSHHTNDIIAIDSTEDNVKKAGDFVNSAFVCDATNEAALKELGVNNVDHAIIAIGSNLQSTILTTIVLKELGIKKITVRIDEDYYVNVIKKLGATDVVSPQKLAGMRLANKIVSDTFIDYFNISSEFCVVEISIDNDNIPLKINEIDSRNIFGVNLLLIQRGKNLFPPTGDDEILPNDYIFVFGTNSNISKFEHYINTHK